MNLPHKPELLELIIRFRSKYIFQNVVPLDITIIINIADTNDPPVFSNLPATVYLKEVSVMEKS